jgi:3-hydroxybutyryl-CoA dehydratase
MKIEDIIVGMSASYSQTITDADIKIFAGVSGDHNPVHVDQEFAEKSRYKKRIAHGLLSASFFSSIFGTKLPGYGCVYASQTLEFKRPIYLDDTVVARVEVIEVLIKEKTVVFNTSCSVRGKVAITGFARIFIP